MGYKGKKAQKTLNTSFCIWYIGDKRMKEINVRGVRYQIETEDELVSITHELAREGYSVNEIADMLQISSKKVKKYMEDCW